MKVWPILTLAGLIWGSFYADGMNTGRESKPHPRGHWFTSDGEDDFKLSGIPHRVATISFQSFFAKMLQDETEWSAPEGSSQVVEDAAGDADDGEDPGKKLFWTTTHPDILGVPFTGWFDPTAEPSHPLMPAYPGTLPPGGFTFYYYIIEDPSPPREDENMATTAALKSLQLPFGALKALDNMVLTGDGRVVIVPCETVLVNGVCTAPCKDNDPLCAGDPTPTPPTTPPVVSDPGSPVVDPPPVVIGGGGGGVVSGTVPEPGTWLMIILGFGGMAFLGWRRASTKEFPTGLN